MTNTLLIILWITSKIKELALKEKKLNAIKKWMKEKIELTYISLNNDFDNCQFNNNWRKTN